MILPTPDYDPLFADDGEPFRAKMIRYIEREFSDLLGDRRRLLRSEAGLEILADAFHHRAERRKRQDAA